MIIFGMQKWWYPSALWNTAAASVLKINYKCELLIIALKFKAIQISSNNSNE